MTRRRDRSLEITRRVLLFAPALGVCAALLAACGKSQKEPAADVWGSLPRLAFSMTRASDGREASAADYLGAIVILYFGYTYCPDTCPATLLNIATVLKGLGKRADRVRVLFVTVDPKRDTLDVLRRYTSSFAPQIVGLRGTDDQIARLARRYRVFYCGPTSSDQPDQSIAHGAGVYVFDAEGEARFLFPGLGSPTGDLNALSNALLALLNEASS